MNRLLFELITLEGEDVEEAVVTAVRPGLLRVAQRFQLGHLAKLVVRVVEETSSESSRSIRCARKKI